MAEFNYRWQSARVQKHLCIRFWWGMPFHALWRWLNGGFSKWEKPLEIELRTTAHDQDVCYCPDGLSTTFRFELFGVGFWGWLSRDWTARPCSCDKIIWLLFPDNYPEEIEDYGLARLQAEFPGVEPCESTRLEVAHA